MALFVAPDLSIQQLSVQSAESFTFQPSRPYPPKPKSVQHNITKTNKAQPAEKFDCISLTIGFCQVFVCFDIYVKIRLLVYDLFLVQAMLQLHRASSQTV
jgi:hypothetical protein